MPNLSTISIKEQLALRIASETQKQMDSVLRDIRRIAEEFQIAEKDKRSPFRNVLAVATESTASLEIIKNYIRYQVGRGSNSSPIWSIKQNQRLFAQALVKSLDALEKNVAQILKRIEDDCKQLQKNESLDNQTSEPQDKLLAYLEDKNNRNSIQQELHLELVRLYLGYLAREHTALVGEKKQNPKSEPEAETQPKPKTGRHFAKKPLSSR